jgi:glyoxylase-like metal-dependent hydrolase (beta-lactamase superfamily II)
MSKLVIGILLITLASSGFSQTTSNVYEVYAVPFSKLKQYLPAKDISINPVVQDSVKLVFMTWLLRGNNGKTILVDAGFQRKSKYFVDVITDFVRPDSSLAGMGIKPGDITDIIISHPHFDHIGGLELFPNAMIWMQKKDYSYFVTDVWQKGGNPMGFDSTDVTVIAGLNAAGRVQLVDGDDIEIIPGIKVYTGSKHTYESQYVVVNSATDKVLIASDNCWFYYNLDHMISIPMTFDPVAYVNSLKRMKTLVKPELIIPGHDAKIFDRFTKVKNGIVKIR